MKPPVFRCHRDREDPQRRHRRSNKQRKKTVWNECLSRKHKESKMRVFLNDAGV
jgi:hypothetical protein